MMPTAKESIEVWGDSVMIFTEPPFWSQGAHSHVRWPTSPDYNRSRSLRLTSQTSVDGDMVGSLYLLPSR
jgi:hypothetical protein